MSAADREDAREGELLQRVITRAVRRLDMLEYVMLAVAAVLATGAGALVAFLIAAGSEWPFRPVWVAASVFFFVVPGALAWWTTREREVGGAPESGDGDRSERNGTTR